MSEVSFEKTSVVYVDPDNERVYHIRKRDGIRGKDVMVVPRSENAKANRRGCKSCEEMVKR